MSEVKELEEIVEQGQSVLTDLKGKKKAAEKSVKDLEREMETFESEV